MLKVLAIISGITAALFAVGGAGLSFHLIHDGIYPPDGNGSLGHVGMVIAGAIAAFLALISAGIAALLLRKAAKMRAR